MGRTVILGCSSLREYVESAQEKLGTSYQTVFLDRVYHRDPAEMREHVVEALAALDPEVDTVLVAMGFCGGSWDRVPVPCRLVIPRVDDCVSLLLQMTDEVKSDLKEPGHLYIREKDPSEVSFKRIFESLTRDIDEETRRRYHRDWQDLYEEIDIIDTGINGCREPEYLAKVKEDADWLDARTAYVPGGTHLLEKLISGKWDGQFLVVEAGGTVDNVLV